MKTVLTLIGLVTLVGLTACGKPQEAKARPKTQGPVPAPVTVTRTPAAPKPFVPKQPTGELHGFAADEVVSVSFKEINERGYPIVMLKNLTGRNIETIRGGFRLQDSTGSILHSTGLTIAVPGQVFIAADGETESSPFGLNRKDELMERLVTSPDELSFSFVAQDVTFTE
jgi:hypothetical protein